jgi:hypothetical protein
MPEYGWVDFETTSEAIPPPPGADPNARNVVIPIIQDISRDEDVFVFPWKFIIKVFLIGAALIVIGLYTYRYGKQAFLMKRSKRNDRKGLQALYTLLLMKKAADGYAVKQPHMTPQEYAEWYPELSEFAAVYTTLRYKEVFEEKEKETLLSRLRNQYRRVVEKKRKGFPALLRRIFNLKGLYY